MVTFNPKPKTKRIVSDDNKQFVRDRDGCCIAGAHLKDGCSSYRGDVHHIDTRGSGGGDVPENMIELCRKHHNQAHTGQITKSQLKGWLKQRYGY